MNLIRETKPMSVNRDSDESDFDADLRIPTDDGEEARASRTSTDSSGKLSVFFRSTIGPSERQEKLQIDPNLPVVELKRTVGNLFGLDPNDFHLSFGGRTADADDIISNYDVEDGMEVLIIPVSLAGVLISS
ncbi:MAG TPA: ubiquitin-like domain-containing protein [Candidatus Hodarchaeales archaeon]|nr:ubiquitin-like domain-containing protein [Candidatus Hodarchaeales archaeon]